jgi:hypothetical protein
MREKRLWDIQASSLPGWLLFFKGEQMDFVWPSFGNFFKRGKRRGYEAQVLEVRTYKNVFNGSQEGRMVLADIANKSGFYRVTLAKDATDREIWQAEGKRLLFGEIKALLDLSDSDLKMLEYAARREAAIDEDPMEGNEQS